MIVAHKLFFTSGQGNYKLRISFTAAEVQIVLPKYMQAKVTLSKFLSSDQRNDGCLRLRFKFYLSCVQSLMPVHFVKHVVFWHPFNRARLLIFEYYK